MAKINYLEDSMEHDLSLEKNLLSYKYDYDVPNKQDIYKICRKITRSNIAKTNETDEKVREEVLKPYFLRSLKVFENPNIIDYYKNKTEKIKLKRDKKVTDHDAFLYYRRIVNEPTKFSITLPGEKLTMSDQMGYAHEMGHIPHYDKPREDFVEYSEALPIFMEYLIALRKKGSYKEAFDYFLSERLQLAIDDAFSILRLYPKSEDKNEDKRLYFTQLFADYYKYLDSLEYTIQLVDRMNEDVKSVGDEIEKVLEGYSLVKTAENLDIETEGCKRLQQEFKRMSR